MAPCSSISFRLTPSRMRGEFCTIFSMVAKTLSLVASLTCSSSVAEGIDITACFACSAMLAMTEPMEPSFSVSEM
eukprot:scaffold143731_cov124-Phaeocystis_antarctica.AAC.2